MIYVYLAMILIALLVIGAYLKRMLPLWLLVRGIQRANEEEEKRSREEYEAHQKWEEQYHKEKQAKIGHMISKGYEEVIGTYNNPQGLWILRVNGRIAALFDLNEKRVPLAELAQSDYAEVIGNIPSIWYKGAGKKECITSGELSHDDWDVKKVNGEFQRNN